MGTLATSISGSGDLFVNSGSTATDAEVSVSGSGDVQFGADVTDTLKITVLGSGDIGAPGTVGDVDITLSGSGDVDVYDVQGSTTVQILGSGDVYIGGSSGSKITGQVVGSGDVSYAGGECDVTSVLGDSACLEVPAVPKEPVSITSGQGATYNIKGPCACDSSTNCGSIISRSSSAPDVKFFD